MRLSSNKLRVYHKQIDRLQAARELRMIDLAYAATAGGKIYQEARREILRRARGDERREIVVSNNAQLKRLLRGQPV